MNRGELIEEIISELEGNKEIENIETIEEIKTQLKYETDSDLFELYGEDDPLVICNANEDKAIKHQVKDACNSINKLQTSIRTFENGKEDALTIIGNRKIPAGDIGQNIINGYKTNLRQLNKYLTFVYLLKEEIIDINQFNVLVVNYRPHQSGRQIIGGFNKRKKETRKNKSKRKKPKNKSKRKKPKNKSKRKKPKNKSTRKTKH